MNAFRLGALLCILGAALPVTLGACSSGAGSEQTAVGNVTVALTGTSATGVSYRLRHGDFTVTGASTTTFSSETNPDAPSVQLQLPAGDYQLSLATGWFLEKLAGGTFTQVNAVLDSMNPRAFSITDQGHTGVVLQFRAGPDVVQMGNGTLDVSIAVNDLTCPMGQTICAGACVDTTSDVNDCGACGTVCNVPGGNAACVNGACTIGACAVGLADCDANPMNGCETSVTIDPNNCGACGNHCATPNGAAVCTAGACTIATCNVGFSNCDGNTANGCETLLDSNPSCASAPTLGAIPGDIAGPTLTASGTGEQRFMVKVNEADTSTTAAHDLSARFTLNAPAGTGSGIDAGCDGCTATVVSNSNPATVILRWSEATSVFGLPTTSDSGRNVFVNISYLGGGGNSCAPWNLNVQGNVTGGASTCPVK